jgi:hypothetical protein
MLKLHEEEKREHDRIPSRVNIAIKGTKMENNLCN